MSPEQATGRPTDKRTDIWAFGCIVFEMLTGRRAFEGRSIGHTLAAMFTQEPDWQLLPPQIPVAIRRLVQRCLERDPHRRIADVAALLFVLEESDDLRGRANSTGPAVVASAARSFFGATWWRVAALSTVTFLLGAALVAGLIKAFVPPLPPPAVTRTTIAATGLPTLSGPGGCPFTGRRTGRVCRQWHSTLRSGTRCPRPRADRGWHQPPRSVRLARRPVGGLLRWPHPQEGADNRRTADGACADRCDRTARCDMGHRRHHRHSHRQTGHGPVGGACGRWDADRAYSARPHAG